MEVIAEVVIKMAVKSFVEDDRKMALGHNRHWIQNAHLPAVNSRLST
jgi:hypothetical protein